MGSLCDGPDFLGPVGWVSALGSEGTRGLGVPCELNRGEELEEANEKEGRLVVCKLLADAL